MHPFSTPWKQKTVRKPKSSKRKQKLYEKFFKNCTLENEMNYKNYRKLFESVKRKSKKKNLLKQSNSKEMLRNLANYEGSNR